MTCSLRVDRAELAGALRTLAKLIKRQQPAEALLSFADGELQIELPGGAVGVPADGQWGGEVRAPGSFVLSLAKALPSDDPLPIFVDQGRLHFAGLSVLCTVQQKSDDRIELPLDPSLLDILRVQLNHSDEEIERAGLTPLVRKAEEKRDAIIVQARNHLLELNVGKADLHHLVDECVKKTGRE